MGSGAFIVLMAVGAAVLTLWTDARFPRFAPTDIRRALMHVGCAMLLGRFLVTSSLQLAGESPGLVVGAIFLVAFPALVYGLLTGLWILKLLQRSFAGHPR